MRQSRHTKRYCFNLCISCVVYIMLLLCKSSSRSDPLNISQNSWDHGTGYFVGFGAACKHAHTHARTHTPHIKSRYITLMQEGCVCLLESSGGREEDRSSMFKHISSLNSHTLCAHV